MKLHSFSNSIIIPVLLFLITIQFAGCLSFVNTVDPGDTPSPDRAYIYGSFVMSNYFRKNIVIALINEDTGDVEMIKFQAYTEHSRPETLSVYSITPGRYSFREMMACPAVRALFTIEKTDCSPRKPFECGDCENFKWGFIAEKGKAHFIGNFTGNSYGGNGGKEIKWGIDSVNFSFEETTDMFLKTFKNFSRADCISAFPGERERR